MRAEDRGRPTKSPRASQALRPRTRAGDAQGWSPGGHKTEGDGLFLSRNCQVLTASQKPASSPTSDARPLHAAASTSMSFLPEIRATAPPKIPSIREVKRPPPRSQCSFLIHSQGFKGSYGALRYLQLGLQVPGLNQAPMNDPQDVCVQAQLRQLA